ncbi:MAG: ECF-type sigma factor [Planctomycetota bacterium]
MIAPNNDSVNLCLQGAGEGRSDAKESLFDLTYEELHRVARQMIAWQAAGHTLQATALVNEAAMRLMKSDDFAAFTDSRHFYAAVAQAMRCVLVDHARKRKSQRRGGERARVDLDVALQHVESSNQVELLELDEALTELAKYSHQYADLVKCRFFLGMTVDEIAVQQGVSKSTIERDWRFIRAWMADYLQGS